MPSSSSTPTARGRRRCRIRAARRPSSTAIRSSSAASAESWRMIRRPVAAPPAWTIRRARVAALEPEREAAVCGRRRSVTPSAVRSCDRRRRLVAQHPGGGLAHRAAPGRRACRRGGGRGCRRRPAPRRARPGPSSWRTPASGVAETSVTRAAGARRAQRRVEAGGACADDGDFGLVRASRGRYGTRRWLPPRPCSCSTPRRSTTTPGRTPSSPRGSSAIERELAAPRLARLRARQLTGGGALGARGGAPGALRRADRARWPPAAGHASTPTRSSRRARSGRAARLPAARSRSSTGCSDGAAPTGLLASTGRPATTPRPSARWASACSTTSPSRRATRSTRTGSSA